ncbi:protein phosphatase 2C domain-containing protein [Streptomyces shenzhenensis]|uniref:protein phosphatase 2C domain-containing protein n=1 Tax=Streptomyces shenzhenensis TaxID=943815 RepID=UPI00381C1495
MSQQGGRPTRDEDDWWGQLYDDATQDTGPAPAADSLDDRFASASHTLSACPPSPPPAALATWRPFDPGPDAAGRSDEGRADTARAGAGDGGDDRTGDADAVPAQRASAPSDGGAPRHRDPWEPPPADPPLLSAFPAATQHRPGAAERVPEDDPHALHTAPESRQDPGSGVGQGLGAGRGSVGDVEFVGSGPPTYDAEPTALPLADPAGLDELVADTVLDGARYGVCTLRAASVRGDSARYRGEPRRDALLTARFGTGEQALILVAMATGARATPGAHRAAAEACQWIGRAVGLSHQRLAEDIHAARRGDLKSGLHRLTDRTLGKLRASATEQGIDPDEYAVGLRCLLLPARPDCRTRVFFGIGDGGLFRLRDGVWQDIEPQVTADGTTGDAVLGRGAPPETPEGDRLTMDLGIPTPPSPYEPVPEPPREPFRFRDSIARPGDALLMCSGGLAEPLRGEPALCAYLARRWSDGTPPGLAAFLADTQVRVKGYADDRTVAAVWEA